MAVNKVVQSNGATLIDISDTTAIAADVASGKYFYLASGEKVEGTASGGNVPHVGPKFTLIGQSAHTLTEYTDASTAETIDTGIDVTSDDHAFLLIVITCDGTPTAEGAWGGVYMDVATRYTTTNRILASTAGVCETGTKSLLISEASGLGVANTQRGPIHIVSNVPTVRFIRKGKVMAGTYTVKVYGIDSL